MEAKILEQNENKTIGYKEVRAILNFEKAIPSANEVKKQVASLMKTKEENVHINKISPRYGMSSAEVSARVYDKAETIGKTTKLGKKALEKMQKAKDAAAQANAQAQQAAAQPAPAETTK